MCFLAKCPTFIVQQHVLWFEVSIDDPLLVEVLHALDDLCGVVTGARLFKAWVVLVHVIDVIPGGKYSRRTKSSDIR